MAKTYEELLEQAAIIRDETAAGKNTATRVGGTITEAVEYVKELKDTYAGIHAEAAAAKQAAAAANTKNAEQDGKISSLEAKDATHDTKIAKIEERVLQYLSLPEQLPQFRRRLLLPSWRSIPHFGRLNERIQHLFSPRLRSVSLRLPLFSPRRPPRVSPHRCLPVPSRSPRHR